MTKQGPRGARRDQSGRASTPGEPEAEQSRSEQYKSAGFRHGHCAPRVIVALKCVIGTDESDGIECRQIKEVYVAIG